MLLSCYWLMLSCSRRHLHPGQRRRPPERPPPLLHTAQMQASGSRGPPWHGAIRATPFLPTQTGPAPPREDATRTSGRESRQRGLATPAPGRTRGAGRTRGGTARPPRRAEGGGARGRAEGRAEFDSRRPYGTHSRNPCTSAAIIPTAPPCISAGRRLHAGWYWCPARPWYSGCYLGSSRTETRMKH
jgi:hypothetical protein